MRSPYQWGGGTVLIPGYVLISSQSELLSEASLVGPKWRRHNGKFPGSHVDLVEDVMPLARRIILCISQSPKDVVSEETENSIH